MKLIKALYFMSGGIVFYRLFYVTLEVNHWPKKVAVYIFVLGCIYLIEFVLSIFRKFTIKKKRGVR